MGGAFFTAASGNNCGVSFTFSTELNLALALSIDFLVAAASGNNCLVGSRVETCPTGQRLHAFYGVQPGSGIYDMLSDGSFP